MFLDAASLFIRLTGRLPVSPDCTGLLLAFAVDALTEACFNKQIIAESLTDVWMFTDLRIQAE